MICMKFIVVSMMYYGMILFKFRKILKAKKDSTSTSMNMEKKEIELTNFVINLDRLMVFIYLMIFIIFNIIFFIICKGLL